MSITGELKFADDAFKPTAETLKLLYGETWGKGYDMGFDAGYASADAWFVDHADELAKHGWVQLPRDADCVPIHIGDVMDSKVDYLFDGRPFEVRAMRCDECGWEVYDRLGDRYEPNSLRHYHEPTVEETLQELIEKAVGYSDAHTTVALDAISEYAAKLRLRED